MDNIPDSKRFMVDFRINITLTTYANQLIVFVIFTDIDIAL